MNTKRMKTRELRDDQRAALRHVEDGGQIIVEHYNRPIARIIPDDPTLVVLRVPSASQADRLRSLVQQHGALGLPFPNNGHPGWRVVNKNGEPVPTKMIPSVQARLTTDQENAMTAETYDHPDGYSAVVGITSDVVADGICDLAIHTNNRFQAVDQDDEFHVGDPIMEPVSIGVPVTADTLAAQQAAADQALSELGWERTSDWTPNADDMTAYVQRA